MQNSKPHISPEIYPVLRYQDGRSAIDWLTRAFGFSSCFEAAGPAGELTHAELSFGSSMIMCSGGRQPDPANPWTTERSGIYVTVADVDAHYARAREVGAEIVMPLRDSGHGSREYSVRDLEGHLWSFGTYRP